MTLVNETEGESDYKGSPLKARGKIRASTIVGTPNANEYATLEVENAQT